MYRNRILKFLSVILPVFIFSVALYFLWHFLHRHSYKEISADLLTIPRQQILMAFALTAASFLILTGYDFLGMDYIGKKLSFAKVALTSFLAFSLSNSIGMAGVAGNSVRYRNYLGWGLSSADVFKMMFAVSSSFWLGFLLVSGASLLFHPLDVSQFVWISPLFFRFIGGAFLTLVFAYFYLCATKTQPIELKYIKIRLPRLRLAFSQVCVAAADWMIAALVLYVLLPADSPLSFWAFLAVFSTAQTIALLTHAPGGIGILEALIIFFVSPNHHPTNKLMAALFAYRLIYYFVPLFSGLMVLSGLEVFRGRNAVKKIARSGLSLATGTTPYLISWVCLISGGVLLWSAFTPSVPERMRFLTSYLHIGLVESSHFFSAVLGGSLFVLGRGLLFRSYPAFKYASIVLLLASLSSLLKGGDYEEALMFAVVLCLLLASRKQFYRQSQPAISSMSSTWIVAVTVVFLGTVWVGLLSYKAVPYQPELWGTFGEHADAPRFMRAAAGCLGVLLFALIYSEVFPIRAPDPEKPDIERLKAILARSSKTIGNLVLLGDKRVLINEAGDAFIMYGIRGRSWIALGDPIGEKTSFYELLEQFKEMADSYGGRAIFYQATAEELHTYADLGMKFMKLGEEARIDLHSFSLEGRDVKGLRASFNKFRKSGATFEIVPAADFHSIYPTLVNISDSWLAHKKMAEKGFSLGFFDKEYLAHFPTALVKVNGETVAFANVWASADKDELSVDLMRHSASAPGGVMDGLFLELIMWGQAQGFRWFNLGMAPLAGLKGDRGIFSWRRIGQLVYKHGEQFYNFQGLRSYKDKFHPVWEPRYMAFTGSAVQSIADATLLISGGLIRVWKK